MRFVTQKDPLQSAISIVQRAVPTRAAQPILTNILLEADADGLKLSGTDHEISICVRVTVDTEEEGRTTLPSKDLGNFVSLQSAGLPQTVEADESDKTTFKCGPSNMELMGMAADEYPPIQFLSPDAPASTDKEANPAHSDASFQVPSKTLKTMIDTCLVAASHDETRVRLTGLQFATEEGHLRVVGTDTHRLATMSGCEGASLPEGLSVIIPARALDAVERLLPDDDSAIDIDLTEDQVQFSTPKAVVCARLIDGEFPAYKRVIPDQWQWRMTLARQPFADAVRCCRVAGSGEKVAKVRLICHRNAELELHSSSSLGRCDQLINDAKGISVEIKDDETVETIETCFDAIFLLDVLNVLACDEVTLELTVPGRPGAIRPVDEASDYVYILMPITGDSNN